MQLDFSGAPEIPAPRAEVWSRLMDPEFIAASAPGVESVEPVDARRFRVISGIGIGVVRLRFRLDVELFDIAEGERLKMRALGRAPGSTVDTVSAVRLEDTRSGGTRLNWSARTEVGGTVASLGVRLVEGIARRLTEQFWLDFAHRVRPR